MIPAALLPVCHSVGFLLFCPEKNSHLAVSSTASVSLVVQRHVFSAWPEQAAGGQPGPAFLSCNPAMLGVPRCARPSPPPFHPLFPPPLDRHPCTHIDGQWHHDGHAHRDAHAGRHSNPCHHRCVWLCSQAPAIRGPRWGEGSRFNAGCVPLSNRMVPPPFRSSSCEVAASEAGTGVRNP